MRLLASILILTMLLSCVSIAVFATTEDDESSSNENVRSVQSEYYLYGGGSSHRYGYTGCSSFDAARAYYGTDFTYHSCSKYYNGNYYNYFYTFSDGDRMYFGVKE